MPDSPIDLTEFDPSGALAERAHAIGADTALEDAAARGDTRAQLLRKAAVGGGALVGGGLLLGNLTGTAQGADTRSTKQDVAILNFALTLEHLEAEFYASAVAADALSGETKTFATTVAAHEAAHVALLSKTLGNAALPKPKFDFKGIPGNPVQFRRTAVTLEDTGVAAYIGQSYRIKRTGFVLIAAQVLAVEARHAAWARSLVGLQQSATDEALNGYANQKQVLATVSGTGFIVP